MSPNKSNSPSPHKCRISHICLSIDLCLASSLSYNAITRPHSWYTKSYKHSSLLLLVVCISIVYNWHLLDQTQKPKPPARILSDLVVKDEVFHQVHVCTRLVGAVLLENSCRNAHCHTVTRQWGYNYRPCTDFAACTNLNGPQNTDPRTKQHTMTCTFILLSPSFVYPSFSLSPRHCKINIYLENLVAAWACSEKARVTYGRMAFALPCATASERDLVKQGDIVAHHCSLSNDNACRMINHHSPA